MDKPKRKRSTPEERERRREMRRNPDPSLIKLLDTGDTRDSVTRLKDSYAPVHTVKTWAETAVDKIRYRRG